MRLNARRLVGTVLLMITVGAGIALATLTLLVRSEGGREALIGMAQVAVSSAETGGATQLGYKAAFGSMGTPGLTSVELKDVVVETRAGEPLLDVPTVRISYSPLRVLFARGDLSVAVTRVELVRPSLHLRRTPSGRWNVQDLLRAGGGQSAGLLATAEATIRVSEGSFRLVGVPGLSRQRGTVVGNLRLSAGRLSSRGISLAYGGARLQSSGSVNLLTGRLAAKLGFSDLDVAHLSAVARPALQMQARVSGPLSGEIRLGGRLSSPTADYRASSRHLEFAGSGGTLATVSDARVEGSYARGVFTVERLSLASGQTRGTVSGRVSRDGEVALEAAVNSSSLEKDLPQLASRLAWTAGGLTLAAQISGTTAKPVAHLALDIPQATLWQLPLRQGSAQATWSGGSFVMTEGRAKVHDQSIAVTGHLGAGGEAGFLLSLPEADVASVAAGLRLALPLSGRCKVEMRFGPSATGWRLSGSATSRDLAYAGVWVDGARADFAYRNGQLEVSNGRLNFGEGTADFGGVVGLSRGSATSVKYALKAFQLADAARASSRLEISGVADGEGLISGQGTDLTVRGAIEVGAPSYGRLAGDSLSARYSFRGGTLAVTELALRRGAASYSGATTVTGLMSGGQGQQISGSLTVTGESVRELAAVAPSGVVARFLSGRSGTVDGRVTVAGPLGDPRIAVTAAMPGVGPSGRPLLATIGLRLADGRLKVAGA